MIIALVSLYLAIAGKGTVSASPASRVIEKCEAFFAPASAPDAPIVAACGKRNAMPADRYLVWLEQGLMISSTPESRTLGDSDVAIVHSMTAAGAVSLAETPAAGTVVRYIHLSSASHAFARTVSRNRAAAPALMPAGRIAGGVFDRKSGDAIALFRSFTLMPSTAKILHAEKEADVFVELAAPAVRPTPLDTIALEVDHSLIPPNDFVDGGEHVYAVWYDVHATAAKVIVPHGNFWVSGQEVALRSGRVTTIRGELLPKPSIDVAVHAGGSDVPPMFLEVQDSASSTPIRHIEIRNGETKRVDALDPKPWQLFLRIGSQKLRQSIDLSDGANQRVAFDVTPLEIHGTVRRGRTSVRAKIGFQDYDGWIDVDTDDSGAYRATLWTPRDYLTRVLVADQTTPFVELVSIADSGTYDFDLPGARYVVRVRDAASESPVKNAAVSFENVWKSEQRGTQNVFLHATTDENGETVLPPLRSGTVSVTAEAKGFERSQPVSTAVESEGERTIDIRLKPAGESVGVSLLFDDGSAAAGAEAMAVMRDGVLWRGTAAEDGKLEIPRSVVGSLIIARHPRAASVARLWAGESAEWLMQPAAAPLAVHVDTDLPRAVQLAAWIDGIRVTGVALGFITWSSPFTNRDGSWIARNLPRQSLRLMAWRKTDSAAIVSGTYDALATSVRYPWSEVVTLRPID